MSKFSGVRAAALALVALSAFALGPLNSVAASAAPAKAPAAGQAVGGKVQPAFACQYWRLAFFCPN